MAVHAFAVKGRDPTVGVEVVVERGAPDETGGPLPGSVQVDRGARGEAQRVLVGVEEVDARTAQAPQR